MVLLEDHPLCVWFNKMLCVSISSVTRSSFGEGSDEGWMDKKGKAYHLYRVYHG